jgi:hypothetical protein
MNDLSLTPSKILTKPARKGYVDNLDAGKYIDLLKISFIIGINYE